MKKSEVVRILKKIGMSNSIEQKVPLIKKLLHSFPHICNTLGTGQILYRANKLGKGEPCPSLIDRISYPPIDKVSVDFGRCNRKQEAVFYTSINPEAALREINLEKGDLFLLSKWRVNETIACKALGYTQDEFLAFHKNKTSIEDWLKTNGKAFDIVNKTFDKWFSYDGSKYYELTSLIANILMKDPIYIENLICHEKIAILYKSLAYPMSMHKADNLAFSPITVDSGVLSPKEVHFCRVDDIKDYEIKFYVEDSTSSIYDENLIWKKNTTVGTTEIINTPIHYNTINT